MSLWSAILLACACAFATKLAGYAIPARWLHSPRMLRVAGALTVALLASLTVMNTFASGAALVLDARLAALAVAALALWLRAPFLLVVAGLAWASGLVAFGVTAPAAWLAWASLAGPGALVIVVDGVTTWLPRVLTRTIAVVATVGLVTWATVEADPLVAVRGGLGALGVGGLFYLVWRVTGGIGFGDVRLMAVVGAVTAAHSVQLTIWAVLAGTIAGAAWGLARRILKGPGAFAYGPALWLGPFLALWVAGPGFPAGA